MVTYASFIHLKHKQYHIQTKSIIANRYIVCGTEYLKVLTACYSFESINNYITKHTFLITKYSLLPHSLKCRIVHLHSLLKSCVRLISTLRVASKTSRITVPADILSARFVTGYNGISESQCRYSLINVSINIPSPYFKRYSWFSSF